MKKLNITPRLYPSISQEGMTLRDHLAVTALVSILKFHLEENPAKNAKAAYRIADAMMQQRDAIPNELDASPQASDKKDQVEVSSSNQESAQTLSKLPPDKVALTPTEFASLFGRSGNWTYRQIYAGKIKVISTLGRIMVPRSEVDRVLEEREIYSGKGNIRHDVILGPVQPTNRDLQKTLESLRIQGMAIEE
jgi:hypothetical protein